MSFYSQATPIDALEISSIGSRPSRRTGKRTLADLRAIPWVFSWNQSRYYLPGWYGVGSALEALAAWKSGRLGRTARPIEDFTVPLLRADECRDKHCQRRQGDHETICRPRCRRPARANRFSDRFSRSSTKPIAMMAEVFGGSSGGAPSANAQNARSARQCLARAASATDSASLPIPGCEGRRLQRNQDNFSQRFCFPSTRLPAACGRQDSSWPRFTDGNCRTEAATQTHSQS